MKTYTLEAKSPDYGGGKARTGILASNDTEATFEAIAYILNRAVRSPLWAKGRITLTSPTGEVLRVMEAKQ